MKKVTINLEGNEVIFSLSHQQHEQALDVHCKFADQTVDLWASFKMSDLPPLYQNLFQKMSHLFNYISDNTEQIEISRKSISISINYLNQSRTLLLPLGELTMCSQQELNRLQSKVRQLQAENITLRSQVHNKGSHKLTLKCNRQTVKTSFYEFINELSIRPLEGNKLVGVFYNHPSNHLPTSGIWYFHLFVTGFASKQSKYFENDAPFLSKEETPQLQIGIRNFTPDQTPNATAVFSATHRLPPSITNPSVNDPITLQDSIDEHDILKIILNMDCKELAIQKNFNTPKMLSWRRLQCDKQLLYLNFYRLQVKTDLFIKDEELRWGTAANE